MSEKYLNYYVELLSSTVNDVVLRNISLQANSRISEDVIAEQQQQIQDLTAKSEQASNSIAEHKNVSENYQNTINDLNSKINTLNQLASEYKNSEHQIAHVDTFRNELIKARKETEDMKDYYENIISELNDKIKYLQLTPAQRKKIDNLKVAEIVPENIKDGGMF